VLCFVFEVFKESFGNHGAIAIKLFVSSDVDDTAFTAKVMEIFQDGKAVNIRGTLSTLASRKRTDKRETYIPSNHSRNPFGM
jgi:predicted acyl esterase